MNEKEKQKLREEILKLKEGYLNYNGTHTKEYMFDFLLTNQIIDLVDQALTDKVASIVGELPLFDAGGVLETGESTDSEIKNYIQEIVHKVKNATEKEVVERVRNVVECFRDLARFGNDDELNPSYEMAFEEILNKISLLNQKKQNKYYDK